MTTSEKVSELRRIVSKYETKSFAGFFAYFIRQRPEDSENIELNKFDSKLKDFTYLIGLNAFSEVKGSEKFELDKIVIADLANKLNSIKNDYRVNNFAEHTLDSVIHEMAFRNHFDNGVLSYVEQDLEKIRTVLTPFDDIIYRAFGFDVDFLIEVYKATEMIAKTRFEYVTEFLRTKEYQEMYKKVLSKTMTLSEGMNTLPKSIQEGWYSFFSQSYAYLIFTKNDLYPMFPSEKVDSFLKVFSCKPEFKNDFNYYTDPNPLELAPILELDDGQYLHICQKQLPIAVYRVIYDYLLKLDDVNFNKIRKHRDQSLELKVKNIFLSFLPTSETFFYNNYCVENNFEQDLLILWKGHALIIEIKASKLREPFRNIEKAVKRLKDDFKDCIQYGYDQCSRVEKYFQHEEKFSIMDKKSEILFKVDPKKYHSVFSIVVTLERFGSLQTDLNLFLQKDEAGDFPWSVYIDDLETFLLSIKKVMKNSPTKFFQFLRKREKLHGRVYAIDELDICGNFLKDPDKFKSIVDQNEMLAVFLPHEQGIFDEIYHAGGLNFNEKSFLEMSRYFK